MAYPLPDLPYAKDALEPHIDARTMEIHHDKHFAGYTNKLNAALEGTSFADQPVEKVLADLKSLPQDKQTAVRNNGGGYLNHSIFFATMSPDGGGEPTGELGEAILSKFGSFERFKEKFATAAATQFGSGWAWLGWSKDEGLHIHALPNQDAPALHGHVGIIGIDVWEHAYYLNYQNRRADYISAWWNVVDWDAANERYLAAKGNLT